LQTHPNVEVTPAPEVTEVSPTPEVAAPHPVAPGIDFGAPLTLDLGRGSGLRGLDLIHVGPEGVVEVHRRRDYPRGNAIAHHWERATLTLDPADRLRLRALMATHRLGELDPLYTPPERTIPDGTQWLMRIRQGEHDHVVYCSNRFPPELRAFATDLDALLARAGLDAVSWERVPRSRSRMHERALWAAHTASQQ